ncbi:MAG TPA: hypothetical protein VFZ66_04975 [Herpetosiphonaceae bacterium]
MECRLPPPITEDQISAAIEGFVDPVVQSHIGQCPSCNVRLQHAQQMEGALKAKLYRWDCPSPQRLGEYVLAMISSQSEERSIVRHLEQCAACKSEVEELGGFLVPNTAPDTATVSKPEPAREKERGWAHTWPQAFGQIFARVVPRTSALAMRGAASGPIMAEADGTTIVLDVQPASEGQVTILGQVVDADQDRWTGALVVLRQAGNVQATATANDLGSFSCGPLAAAPVELMIASPVGQTVVLPEIDVSA